eukprot:jgi/Picsp_1/1586/NSC_05064-R1_repeat-containing protein a_05
MKVFHLSKCEAHLDFGGVRVRLRRRHDCITGCHATAKLHEEIRDCSKAVDLLMLLKENERFLDSRILSLAWGVILNKKILAATRALDKNSSGVNKELTGLLLEHTMELVSLCTPKELSLIARAMVATNTGAGNDIVKISRDIQNRLITFEPEELCMVLWALSTHPGIDVHDKHGLFGSLSALVNQEGMSLDLFTAQDLSILVWSMGNVNYNNAGLLTAAESVCVNKMNDFDSKCVARIMHGFSNLGFNPTSFLPKVFDKYQNVLDEFSAQDLTLFTVSLGKLVVEPTHMFSRALSKRAKALVPKDSSSAEGKGRRNQAVNASMMDVHLNAQMLWAFGRLGIRRSAFATQGILYASLCVEDHLEDDLAAVLWACCRLNLKLPPNLLENASLALAMHAEKEVSKSLAQSLRYLVILTSREMEEQIIEKSSLGYIESQLSRALIALAKHTGQISGWDISTLIIAYSTLPNLSLPHEASLRIQHRLIESIQSLPSRVLSKLAFALVKLKMTEARLVDALYASVEHKAGIIPLDGLVHLAFSFASFQRPCQHVSGILAERIISNLNQLTTRDKSRAAFAFSRMRSSGNAVVKPIVRSISEKDIASMDASCLVGLVRAMGTLDSCHAMPLTTATAQRVASNLQSFNSKQLAMIERVLLKQNCTDSSAMHAISQQVSMIKE